MSELVVVQTIFPRIRVERDQLFEEGSIADRIFVQAKQLFQHSRFAEWFAKVFTRRDPSSAEVAVFRDVFERHAPELRFTSVQLYNRRHPGTSNLPLDVFAFYPWNIPNEEHVLVFNEAWFPSTLDPAGARTERQKDIVTALGVITFLHELAHYCVWHLDLESPLTASITCMEKSLDGRVPTHDRQPHEYEYAVERMWQEAGFRLEEYVFGGRPALAHSGNPVLPSDLVLDVKSDGVVKPVAFPTWPNLLGDVDYFFDRFPVEMVTNRETVESVESPVSVRCSCGGLGLGRHGLPLPLPPSMAGGSRYRQRPTLSRQQ